MKVAQPKGVFLFGAPGVGKDVMGQSLLSQAEQQGLRSVRVVMGDIVREERNANPEFEQRYGRLIDGRGLVPDSVILRMLQKHLKGLFENKYDLYIFDGPGRTATQAGVLGGMCKDLDLRAIFIDKPAAVCIENASGLRKRGVEDRREVLIRALKARALIEKRALMALLRHQCKLLTVRCGGKFDRHLPKVFNWVLHGTQTSIINDMAAAA